MNHPIIGRIRDLLHLNPFHPFTLKMVDGTVYEVPHEDFVVVTKSGAVIFDDGERIKTINATLITEIEEKAVA